MRYTRIDVLMAMTIAALINLSMLVMAARTFYKSGLPTSTRSRPRTRRSSRSSARTASALFAIALLGSGLSSSAVGTLAGQVVMQGFIRRRIPVVVRRT